MINKTEETTRKIYDRYCAHIIRIAPLNVEDNKYVNKLLQSLEDLNELGYYIHVPYAQITDKIYKMELNENDSYAKVYRNIEEKFHYIDTESNFKKRFEMDTLKDIELALVQREYMNELSENTSSLAKNTNEKLEEIKSNKGDIYADFISILGIFTAITFATFGGLQLLGNIFGNIKNMNVDNVSNIITLGSIYVFCVYLILITLFKGVSKFTTNEYHLSVSFDMRVIIGIFILFAIGTFYEHKEIIVLCSFIILLCYFFYAKFRNNHYNKSH